ncbi:serine hydrolase domain-containing protein [Paracidobacterium acidisoli]|uniref:Class A beta-lactamase-related serine hydrolase n=1 Tax=Paracidobacterium acidisoli TaxID=2303751 RepID=A0A372IK68_9BACT|nr:serine hydrolase domain-containing protein [Paracidobacterium acidisoli]MBT9332687.1 beta-lactamase family protein [Paracidobacterium acidisoli]
MPPPVVAVPESAAAGRERFAAARAVIEEAIARRAFPGASWGVWHNGEIVALDAAGRFTYTENSPQVAPGTVFDLASVTKVVATTAAAMLLYDRGILHLDARLGDILPGFVIGMEPGSGKERVTLRMLLAHSSGLPGYARLFEKHATPEGMLRACLRMPLEAQPGERMEYSDLGFLLLGKAIEILSGDLLARFCTRAIFEPLGLDSMRFCPPEEWRPFIPPTEDDAVWRQRVIQGEVQDENCAALGGAAGHAGVFAHALDVLCFAGCVLAEGRSGRGQPLFRAETVRLFATRQTEPEGTSRALGWDTPTAPSSSGRYFSARSIGHLGYAGTSLWIDPERGAAVVLLTNRTWPDRASKEIQRVRPAFHDAVIEALTR